MTEKKNPALVLTVEMPRAKLKEILAKLDLAGVKAAMGFAMTLTGPTAKIKFAVEENTFDRVFGVLFAYGVFVKAAVDLSENITSLEKPKVSFHGFKVN